MHTETLYRDWKHYVMKRLRERGVPEQDVDDYLQECFIHAHRNIHNCHDNSEKWFMDFQIRTVFSKRAKHQQMFSGFIFQENRMRERLKDFREAYA